MKYLNITLLILVLLTYVVSINAQDDFSVKLSETEINKTLDAIIAARGLNFGTYYGEGTLDAWYANIDVANVDIKPNNKVELIISDIYFVAEINFLSFEPVIATHFAGTLYGEILLEGNATDGYNIILHFNEVDYENSWGDLSGVLGIYAELFAEGTILNYIPDIPISLTDLTPDIVLDIFDFGTPPISSDNESIYLNYNVKGDRFVKIYNELQLPTGEKVNTEGDIYHLEGSSYQPYPSGFEFAWDKNSQQTFKSEENGVDYSVDNNHYKFNEWQDGTQSIIRTNTIDTDYEFYAKLYNSYNVKFNMTYEGTTGSFGNININGDNFTFPKSEYIFAPPLAEPVTINSSISNSGKNYQFLNWSDGNTNLTRNISPTAPTSLTANYKGIQLTNNHASYNKNNQNKMVRVDGKLYKVYESMNRIWLERSSNNGSTWEILNGGQPIDISSGGRYPSIGVFDNTNNQLLVIVYNLFGSLRIQHWSQGAKQFDAEVNTGNWPNDYFSNSSIPVISYNYSGRVLIAWAYSGSIAYQFGNFASGSIQWYFSLPQFVTSSSSNNVSISKQSNSAFHIAWQEGWSNIKYAKLNISGSGHNNITISDEATISTGCGYPTNYYPSITTSTSGNPIVAWVGSPYYGSNATKIMKRSRGSSGWNSYGKYEKFVQRKDDILTNESRTFKLYGKGIGNKLVKLKMIFDTDIKGKYTLLDIRDNTLVLPKKGESAVSVSYAGELEIKDYTLSQNFPNPFNPSTVINYQIPNDGFVSLKVYDITGQEVATLVNQAQTKGRYEINFDATNLSSGVYLYRLTSGTSTGSATSFTESMKMLLLK